MVFSTAGLKIIVKKNNNKVREATLCQGPSCGGPACWFKAKPCFDKFWSVRIFDFLTRFCFPPLWPTLLALCLVAASKSSHWLPLRASSVLAEGLLEKESCHGRSSNECSFPWWSAQWQKNNLGTLRKPITRKVKSFMVPETCHLHEKIVSLPAIYVVKYIAAWWCQNYKLFVSVGIFGSCQWWCCKALIAAYQKYMWL